MSKFTVMYKSTNSMYLNVEADSLEEMYKSTNSMYLNVEADSLEEAKETAENTDGGEFINAGSGDWEYDYTEDENGNVIDTGNNDFLREQLKELQADLLDMSDKELVECRSLLLERINWCMTAILERR